MFQTFKDPKWGPDGYKAIIIGVANKIFEP
jgi:hypothetical protein